MGNFKHLALAAVVCVAACQEQGSGSSPDKARTHSVKPTLLSQKTIEYVSNELNSAKSAWALAYIQNTGPHVSAKEYSWQVGLRVLFAEAERCGGTLISKRFILTAAHCVDRNRQNNAPPAALSFRDIQVFHGADEFGKGTVLTLDTHWPIQIHDQWRKTGIEGAYDAAILKLKDPVSTAVVAPVRSVPFTADPAVVSGWGSYDYTDTPSPYLRAVKLPVVKNSVCRDALAADPTSDQAALVGDWSLCTMSTTDTACSRDSGGPLVVGPANSPQTIGIVSWGAQDTCRIRGPLPQLVTVYTRGSTIANWVERVTRDRTGISSKPYDGTFDVRPRDSL